jgi:hypothetical protein
MKRSIILAACWLAAILIMIGITFLSAYLENRLLMPLAGVLAAIDAKYARIWKIDSALPEKPSHLFFWLLLLGWFFLPWYLAIRFKMLTGIAKPKEPFVVPPYRFQGRISD